MGLSFSTKSGLSHEELKQLQVDTDLSKSNLRRLKNRFLHLDRDNKGYLDRSDLLSIPEIQFNPIGDRIVSSFFPKKINEEGKLDLVESERVYFNDFAKTFAVFRQVNNSKGKINNLNSKEQKIRFLYDLIDDKGQGNFGRDELLEILEVMVGVNIHQDQLVMIADRVVSEADKDNDGFINFEEFKNAISKLNVEEKMAFIGFK